MQESQTWTTPFLYPISTATRNSKNGTFCHAKSCVFVTYCTPWKLVFSSLETYLRTVARCPNKEIWVVGSDSKGGGHRLSCLGVGQERNKDEKISWKNQVGNPGVCGQAMRSKAYGSMGLKTGWALGRWIWVGTFAPWQYMKMKYNNNLITHGKTE